MIKPRTIVWHTTPSVEAPADDVDVDAPMLIVDAATSKREADASDGLGSGSEADTEADTDTVSETASETASAAEPLPPPTLRCASPLGELRDGRYVATLIPPMAAVDIGAGCALVLRGATLRGITATPTALAVPAVRAVGGGVLRLENCRIDGDIVVVGEGRIELRSSRHRGNQRVIGPGIIDIE